MIDYYTTNAQTLEFHKRELVTSLELSPFVKTEVALRDTEFRLRAHFWTGNPGPKVVRSASPHQIRIDYVATGYARVPATWWDMVKESLFTRNHSLASGLVSWGLMRDVSYKLIPVRIARQETRNVDVSVSVHVEDVLPLAAIPSHMSNHRLLFPILSPLHPFTSEDWG
jgi:hypothetical protein